MEVEKLVVTDEVTDEVTRSYAYGRPIIGNIHMHCC
jgi:hypothetical protein